MAISKSGFYPNNLINMMKAAHSAAENLTLATYKIYLVNNTFTAAAASDFSTTAGYSAAPFNANEVSGTGWASGGVLLSAAATGATSTAPTVTESPAGTVMWDMGDVSVASTTLTNARACIIYADPITTPVAKPPIILVNFGADYSTTNGTFGIQWAATGVGTFALVP